MSSIISIDVTKPHALLIGLLVLQASARSVSLVVRKAVSGVSDQVRHKPGCAMTEND